MAIDNPSQDVELRLEVIANLRDAIRGVEDFNEGSVAATKATNKLADTARKAMGDFDGLGKSAKGAGADIRRAADQGSAEWQQGTAELRKLNEEYRKFRQQAAVGGAPVANPLASLSSASKTRLIGIADADSASVLRTLREEADKAGGAFGRLSDSELPRLRYALYDVSSTANITAAAITAVGAATIVASARYESAFTGVERTLDPAFRGVEQLHAELLQMSRDSPKSFVDLSAIATLGNQLGVAGDDVAEFTDVISKYSTVSGMTAEASAQAFGRLANILGYPIENIRYLASSIELAGVNSASTDQEILALAQRLGATATRAGFTADQVVGLSSALGSLGVAPERAQGVFETYFNSLNESLSEGGKKLEAFSAITGTTVDELQTLVRTGQGFEVFQKFLSGLQGGDTVQLTAALGELGLSGLRANEVIGRISQNMPLLQQSFAIAAKGAADGTELNRQYALILDDLASKWQILVNGALEFASAIGTAVAPAAKIFLDIITNILHGLTDFIATPFGQWIAHSAAMFAVVTVAIAGTVGGLALFGASLAAVRTAIVALGLEAFVGRLGAAGFALLGTSKAAWAAAGNLGKVRIALLGLMRATVVLGLIQVLIEALFNLQAAGDFVIDVFTGIAQSVVAAGRIISDFLGSIPGGGIFKEWAGGLQVAYDEIANFRNDSHKEWGNFADDMGWVTDEVDQFSDSAIDATDASAYLPSNIGDIGDAAEETAAKVRTLADYASDLSGVLSRAFDIRYGGQQGFDTITTGWNTIRDAAEAAAQAARDHQTTLAGLNADRSIKEYWLSIAEMYGDELRASKLRADLAEINGKVADTSKDLAKEQQKSSMTLDGNTDAAIANRASLLGLVGNYNSYIAALASSGISQAELQAKSAQLKQEFIQQATQMGFSRSQVDLYAQSFDDMSISIANIPRDITVTANVNPALQALNEFAAAAAAAESRGVNIPITTSGGADKGSRDALFTQWATAAQKQYGVALAQSASGWAAVRASWERGAYNGYSDGGYTGGGSVRDVAGVVHKKEFVFSAPAVRNMGVSTLSNIHQAAKSGRPFMSASTGSAPTGPVDLSPYSIQALAAALSPALYLDGQRLAQNAGMHNANSTALGAS